MSPRRDGQCQVCGGDHLELVKDGRRWLTVREAAAHFNTSDEYVRKLIRVGRLRWVQPSERTTRVSEADVWELLHDGQKIRLG